MFPGEVTFSIFINVLDGLGKVTLSTLREINKIIAHFIADFEMARENARKEKDLTEKFVEA